MAAGSGCRSERGSEFLLHASGKRTPAHEKHNQRLAAQPHATRKTKHAVANSEQVAAKKLHKQRFDFRYVTKPIHLLHESSLSIA